jgi:hypothetical protein
MYEIELALDKVTTHGLAVHEFHSNNDIFIYVRACFAQDKKLSRWPRDVQLDIEQTLLRQVNGMFRWITCQLDVLRSCLTLNTLRKELRALPASLDETYERILLRLNPSHQEQSFRILQWLAFAARPVTMEELVDVLAADSGPSFSFDAGNRLIEPKDILLLGSSLIVRSCTSAELFHQHRSYNEYSFPKLFSEDSIDEIRLAHLSVKDYLVSKRIRASGASAYSLNAELTHAFMANTCLGYLLHSAFQGGVCYNYTAFKSRLFRWPLLHYAAHFWPHHVEGAGEEVPEQTWQLITRFFNTRNLPRLGNFGAWAVTLTPDIRQDDLQNTTMLYYAASFGATSLVRKLLTSEDGPRLLNQRGGRYQSTPIQVASFRGRFEVVKILLEAGASLDFSYVSGGSALYWAAGGGHTAIRNLIESYGATLTAHEKDCLAEILVADEVD